METKAVTITSNRQITLPAQFLRSMGVDKGEKLYAVYDQKRKMITLQSRKQVLFNMMRGFDGIREAAIRENPEIRKNIESARGKSVEELRQEWDETEEGKRYYKEKYGIDL